jgi:hypothetical protein
MPRVPEDLPRNAIGVGGTAMTEATETRGQRMKRIIPIVVGLISIGVGVYVSMPLLEDNDWNPSVLIKFPEASGEQLRYGNEMLGDVVPAGGYGHDGKYYFMQAMDPFYTQPDDHAFLLDRPSYRAQRMVYPTVAGGFGLLPPEATAWSLWGVNMIALAIGGWLTARLAVELGLSPWFGLAFVFNPGILVSSLIDTAEVFAMVFFIASALALMRRRYLIGAVFLSLAALSRETMILAAIGAIVYIWRTERKVPWVLGLPFVTSAAWWLYLRAQIGYLDDGVQDVAAVGVPFKGFYDAVQIWLSRPDRAVDMMFGVILLVVSLLIVKHAWQRPSLLGYMTAGFALVAVSMVGDVWKFYFDASRALAPVITVYVLMVPAALKQIERQREDSPDPQAQPTGANV